MISRIVCGGVLFSVAACNTPTTGAPTPSPSQPPATPSTGAASPSASAAPSTTVPAPLSASAAPSTTVPAAPSASAPAASPDERCMSAADSQDRAKPHKNADPPYADCAAGVFSHCGPEHHYCSRALDVPLTKTERRKGPMVCCY